LCNGTISEQLGVECMGQMNNKKQCKEGEIQRDICTWPFLQNITLLYSERTHSHLYTISRWQIL